MIKNDSQLPCGVFAASLTPQNKDLRVNYKKLIEHCQWLLTHGCHGIAVLGTTGEANSFALKERMELLDVLVKASIPPNVMLVGTGCCALPDTVDLTKHAIDHGVGGVLVLPPFYYKNVSEDGVFQVFDQLIQQVGDEHLSIYLYHLPKMTGVPFSYSLIQRLIQNYPGTIVGMKDSSGDWNNMKLICEHFPDFKVYAGSEQFLLDILRIGGAGCITATTNVTCPLARKVFDNWESEEADTLQKQLTEIRLAIQQYPLIPALKSIMANSTNHEDWLYMRPPHVQLRNKDTKALKEKLRAVRFRA